MAAAGSTLARRALGRQMNMMRERAKISQSEAARIIGVSPQSIGRLEFGPSPRLNDLFLNTLCNAYGASDGERQLVLSLAHEVRASCRQGGGWWRAYADQIIEGFNHYLALEEAASEVTSWKLSIVPGLLQTEAYRRVLEWAQAPNAPTEEIEKRVELAMRRQTRLEDHNFAFNAFLSEGVLRDQAGGPNVMEEQLRHLLKLADLPNVSIRIVPFDARSILGPAVGSFVLMDFPPLPHLMTEPSVVYVEGHAGDLYLEREFEVDRYRGALREIARVALDDDESRAVILAIAEEYGK